MRILVVEDDSRMANVIAKGLRENSYAVDVAHDGEAGLYQASINDYDVIVLDVLLPQHDGFEVCRELRTRGDTTPVLMLTARAAIDDRIAGFDAGADDYLTKPFAMEELLARLRGLVRRAGLLKPSEQKALVVGDLVMDEEAREVSRRDVPIDLTVTEFELLRFLMRNPRRVLSKSQILDRVWSYDFGGDAHVVELYISYLRRKVDRDRSPMIHTVRGVGYVLKPA